MAAAMAGSLRGCVLLAVAVLACGSLGEESLMLEDGAPDQQELLGESLFAANDHASLEYARFAALKQEDHFIRHLNEDGVITTASSDEDQKDVTWRIRPALCAPGSAGCPQALQGAPRCVSMESANWAGYYMTHTGAASKIVVAKQASQASRATATFCIRPGLADKTKLSLESLVKPGHFVRHNMYKLFVCDNTDDSEGGCGKTSLTQFREDSTFSQSEPSFFGLCQGPTKPTQCRCAAGRTGPKCADKCPGLQKNGQVSCSGHGACAFDSTTQKAMCKCQPGTVGAGCSEACPKGLNSEVCSNNGQCAADDTGKAKCKCLGSFRGHTCEHTCPGSDDTKVCSGKGKCNYDEVEKVTFCKCQSGHLGSSCAVACEKDSNGRICSENGLCAPDGPDKAKCVCKVGFLGSDCAIKCNRDVLGRVCGGGKQGTCVKEKGAAMCKCKPGFLGTDCNTKCPGSAGKKGVCGGQGTCFLDTKSNNAKCVCKAGYTGPGCDKKCPMNSNLDVCNGQGKCGADAKCTCNKGFIGLACEHNCPGNSATQGKVACNGHGSCEVNAAGSKAVCKCASGFMGDGCALTCPRHEGRICNGQGDCHADHGIGKCACKQGFKGSKCESECPGRTATSVCGAKGKCVVRKGGETACVCDKGFGGKACAQSCPVGDGQKGDPKPCFGKGECVSKAGGMQCLCQEGWLGKGCDVPCPTSKSGEVCGKRGMCMLGEAGKTAKCECKPGFVGSSCLQLCPKGDNGSICSGHGDCKAHGDTAVCRCHKDFTGGTCSKGCPKDKEGTICSGQGKCVLKDNQAQCTCNVGRSGKACGVRICGTENSLFDAKNSRCLCEPGYTCCSSKKLEMIMNSSPSEVSELTGLEEFE